MTAAVALRRPPPDPRQLQRCLLLAVLLHIWLVLVFGNATGTAAPGQGVWGSLTVKLLGKSGSEAGAPPGETGSGRPPRQAESGAPGSAELGRFNPREVPAEAARTEEASAAPPSTATLDLPEGFKPIERENLSTPPPLATPLPTPSAELPAAVGRLEARPDAAVTPLPSAASLRTPSRPAELPTLPAEMPAAVNRLDAAPTLNRAITLPSPAELRAAPAPAAIATPSTELPAPVRRLEAPAEAGATATLPRPAELRAAPGAISQPVPSTSLPAAVQRLEAPAADAADAAAVTRLNRSSELRTPAPTAAAPLPSGQDLPAPVRRLESAASAGDVAPLQPTASPRATLTAPGASSALPELSNALPGQVSAPAGLAKGDPNASPFAAPKASAGSPDAGPRLGPDLPAPPSAAASAARAPLNLSLPRGDIAARRSHGLIDMLPQPPERKSKLEQSIEDAASKDCRKAYAGAGILAVVPLAVDAARGKGCKW